MSRASATTNNFGLLERLVLAALGAQNVCFRTKQLELVTMPVDRRKIALYVIAANVRLVIFLIFPGIPDLLTGQVEVSTPVSSFKRCTLLAIWKTVSI